MFSFERMLSGAAVVAVVMSVGCSDPAKKSAEAALPQSERLTQLIDSDVGDVRKGLPTGAKKLGEEIFKDPSKEPDPKEVRETLRKTRESVNALQVLRSTFFAVTDAKGVAIASDQDSDGFVGKNLLESYAALSKATAGGDVETIGSFDPARGVAKGDDAQWISATPIKIADGSQKGTFVTGWSLRRYADRLQEQLNTDFRLNLKKGEMAKAPLLYVFVVVGDKAYGSPRAPEVNQKAVEGLKITEKVQGDAPFTGTVTIEGRGFGVAARKAKSLSDKAYVVLLRSEV